MATSTSLSLVFDLASGSTRTISISIPKDGLTEEEARTCMESMVQSGAAFTDALTGAVSATLRETSTTVLFDDDDTDTETDDTVVDE